MKRVMITGALGHIGSRLIHELRPGEFEGVLLVDNLSSRTHASLFRLPAGVPFRFLEDDVCTMDLDRALEGVDVVVHLAALTDAARSFAARDEVRKVNFEGTVRLAEACAARRTRLIFASTTSVYGVQEGVVDEDCPSDALKPQSPYAESKLLAERHLEESNRRSGLRYVCLRLGTIFGTSPGMRFHTAINKFVWQACTGRPLTIWNTAMYQRRPYLDLGDAIRAFRVFLEGEAYDGGTYNVLTLNATVAEILSTIRRFVPDVSVKFVDAEIMNQLSYAVSNQKIRSLGFIFGGDLEAGIRDTFELLRGLVNSPFSGVEDLSESGDPSDASRPVSGHSAMFESAPSGTVGGVR